MNLFFLALSLTESVRDYCDAHCIKIILEAAQMLSTAYHLTGYTQQPPSYIQVYKQTHQNHPMSQWVRVDINNFNYTVNLALELCSEYSRRYSCKRLKRCQRHYQCQDCPIKQHKCQPLLEWMRDHPAKCNQTPNYKATTRLALYQIPTGCTPVPLCMPAKYQTKGLILSYRLYYAGDKAKIAKWSRSNSPNWFEQVKKLPIHQID